MLSVLAVVALTQGTRLPAVRLGDQDFRPTLPTWRIPAGGNVGQSWQELQAKLPPKGTKIVEWPLDVRIILATTETNSVGGVERFSFTDIAGANYQGCLNELALFTYLVRAYSDGKVEPKINLVRDERIGPFEDEPATDSWSRFTIIPNRKFDGFQQGTQGRMVSTTASFYSLYDRTKPGLMARALFNAWIAQVENRLGRRSAPLEFLDLGHRLHDFSKRVSDADLQSLASGTDPSGPAPSGESFPAGEASPTSLKQTFEPGAAEALYGAASGLVSAKDTERGDVALWSDVAPIRLGMAEVLFDGRGSLPAGRKLSFWVKGAKEARPMSIETDRESFTLFGQDGRIGVEADGQWHRVILPLAEARSIRVRPAAVDLYYTFDTTPSVWFDDFEILDGSSEADSAILAVRPAPDARSPEEFNRLAWIANLTPDLAPLQIAELRAMLSDSSGDVQLNAARLLAVGKVAEAVPDLIIGSNSPNPIVAQYSIEGLAAIGGEEAQQALMQRLRGPFPHSRRLAIRALAKPGAETLVKEFSLALAIRDIALREEAARGMAIIGTPQALKTGYAFLNDGDFRVRDAFLAGLTATSPVDPKRLAQVIAEDTDARVRARAAAVLVSSDNPATRAAAAKFGDQKSAAGRYRFLTLLETGSAEAKALATKFSSDSDRLVRETAANYLAKH